MTIRYTTMQYMKVEVHQQVYSLQDQLDLIAKQIDRSMKVPQVREDGSKYMIRDLALEIVHGCPQHGILGEHCQIARVFNWVKSNVEYRHDPVDYDMFLTAGRTINAGGSDCVTLDTKIIVRSKAHDRYEIRTMGELRDTWPAYDALSYDFDNAKWVFSPITNWVSKGFREVFETHVSTGPSFKHTADHVSWWYDGQGTNRRISEAPLGDRFDEDRSYFRRAIIAGKIPAIGSQDYSEALAYTTGIYAAEGYADPEDKRSQRVCIAQDKISIRERIEKHLDTLGSPYSKSARDIHSYYNIHRGWLKDHLCSQGRNSFDMGFDPAIFGADESAILTALNAHADGDAYIPKTGSAWASKVDAIHATSSEKLADQLQLMCMILGKPWHTQLQLNHGGAGNSPIFRVHRWSDQTQNARRTIEGHEGLMYSPYRSSSPVGEEEVADISVAGTHNFVLSNGLILHNCDDHTTLICSLLASIGFRTGAKVISPDQKAWHIYPVVKTKSHLPPHNDIIVPLDTTQPGSYPGWEPDPIHRKYSYLTVFQDGRAHYKKVSG